MNTPPRALGTFVILFRGVGGGTQLPTQLLREKLVVVGFEGVATYINSGNAVVCSRLDRKTVISRIAKLCRVEFAFAKAIFALTLAEWEELMVCNPFAQAAIEAPTTVHAVILESPPSAANIERVLSCRVFGEDLKIVGEFAYLHTPHGFGKSRMAGKFDQWIGVPNTARNWNTVVKLAALARAAAVRTS